MTALLVAQLVLAAAALSRAGYLGLRTVREATFARFVPYPILTLTTSGKESRHKLASWLGISVTILIVPWLLVAVGHSFVTPPSSTDTREFTVVVSHPDGQQASLGGVQGFAACEEQAAHYARAHGIFELDWGFQCCLKGSPSECEPILW